MAFADVNLSEESIRDGHSPGAGGWPTIRYFNEKTGVAGGTYVKKTDKSMCDELGDDDMMTEYVESYGDTSLCSAGDGAGCDERELGYIEKMKAKSSDDVAAQLKRLEGMDGGSMKKELQDWMRRRKKILKQLVKAGGEEL